MIDISVQNIKKAFEEGNDILDGISFDIDDGEHVGLLGKNGAGKTTLLKIITGELTEDEGDIIIPENKVVGMISQIPEFPVDYTAEDVLRSAFSRLYKIKADMENQGEAAKTGIEAFKAWIHSIGMPLTLTELGIPKTDLQVIIKLTADANKGKIKGFIDLDEKAISAIYASIGE